MIKKEKIVQIAKEYGFFTVSSLDVKTVISNIEVRKMCEANKCHKYNENWTCPPACGTLEECQSKINTYENGILLQTVGDIEDSFDFEAMEELESIHKKRFSSFVEAFRKLNPNILPLNVGCCTNCEICTYPDEACRMPEKAYASLEGFGLLVSELCQKNGAKYYYGSDKMAYTACVLY
ncbi:MAG: DUF2284 domain-containing protein [Eubacterium sp.]